MHLEPDHHTHRCVITRCDKNQITVNDTAYHHSIALTPNTLLVDWSVPSISTLTQPDLAPLIAMQPELILLGSGSIHCFPPPEIMQYCHQYRIGLEVMDTQATCRTFNLLASDGRNVIAGLILDLNSND